MTCEKHRVLVADDEPDMVHGLVNVLQRNGYAAHGARDGREAADILRAERFDVVVADLKMPGPSGMDLLRMVREKDDAVVFIVITAYGTVDSAVEAMMHGASDYISKPFAPSALTRAVENGLRKRTPREPVLQRPPWGGYQTKIVPRVDRETCTGCGVCPEACDHGAITIVGGRAEINLNRCVSCGSCIDACPVGTLSKTHIAVAGPDRTG